MGILDRLFALIFKICIFFFDVHVCVSIYPLLELVAILNGTQLFPVTCLYIKEYARNNFGCYYRSLKREVEREAGRKLTTLRMHIMHPF